MDTQDYPTIQRDQLCLRCRAIDLDDLFDIKRLGHCPIDRENAFVMDLESSAAALRSSVCLLCKLLCSTVSWGPRVRFKNSASNTTCHIHVHARLRYLPIKALDVSNPQKPRNCWSAQGNPDQTLTLISVGEVYTGPDEDEGLESGMYSLEPGSKLRFLGLSSPRQRQANVINGISIRRGHYDVGFVKQCMTRCRNEHDDQCNNLSIENCTIPSIDRLSISKAPPNSEYTALSYVWGVQGQAADIEVSLNQPLLAPHKCPKAINDSVQVTLDLNLKYLWIDKYCIDQFDDQDKAIQIGQMDSIYANAAVTIIAAAGKGPHHGLPGVDGTLRNTQPALKIGEHLIASMLRLGAQVVSESKWATRGWTYQEGILSKRRLIFTDEQVHWECNNIHYAEAIDYKPDRPNPWRHWRKLPNGIFLDKTPETEPAEFFRYIAELRKRTLTYQSDSLNALSGIFRAFEKGEWPIYQLAGVPIFYPMRLSSDEQTITPKTLNQGFLIGLTWRNLTPDCERVPMFPSWSWAGWTGPVHRRSAVPWRQQCLDVFHVWIETGNGELRSFPESQLMKDFLSQLPGNIRYIQIEARTFTCSIRYDLLEEEQKRPTATSELLLQVSENSSTRFLLLAYLEGGLRQGLPPWPNDLTGILIGDTSGDSFDFAAILVKEHDGFMRELLVSAFWVCPTWKMRWDLDLLTEGGKEMFSNWMRNETVKKTIRLG